ncbi:RNA polymerase B, partial [Coemansia nantahalensis]
CDSPSKPNTEPPSASSSDFAGGSPPDGDGADGGASVASSSVPASSIKERRLRAGMRYTQGGKKTYWLPVEPVDHRAVAFAAGGAGRTRAALLHGTHPGTSIAASVQYIGSAIHSSSRAVHESRRVQKHAAAAGRHLPEDDARPTEHTRLIARPPGGLSELSMDSDAAGLALDDALFAEARAVEGDFNYPVMEIGVAVGYAHRRPYGNTLPRRSATSADARPRIQSDHFSTPPTGGDGDTIWTMRMPKNKLVRPVTEESLDAARLELGVDFQDAECLLISEVKVLLEAQYDSKKEEKNLDEVYTKTLEYVQKFSRYTNRDTIKEVRALLKPTELEPFECAQLGNLCCSEYEEAKSLVPSIGSRISDEDLDSLLKQMDSLKKYQG